VRPVEYAQSTQFVLFLDCVADVDELSVLEDQEVVLI
jgi:hypothetical protein